MKSEKKLKELADRFMNNTMFVRTIFCNPAIESAIKKSVKADDIRVYTSDYIEKDSYILSKDINREVVILEQGFKGDDFEKNQYTIVCGLEFT